VEIECSNSVKVHGLIHFAGVFEPEFFYGRVKEENEFDYFSFEGLHPENELFGLRIELYLG
jgi:hypothetical protein